MTKPRERCPNTLWFVTRRTHNGEFRLRPDDEVTNAIGYIVAIACWRYAIDLVTFVAMSNHYHATLSDPHGRIADWECYVHGKLAKYLNARHKRTSHVFDASEGNALEVEGQAFIAKSVYTLVNPTKAGPGPQPARGPATAAPISLTLQPFSTVPRGRRGGAVPGLRPAPFVVHPIAVLGGCLRRVGPSADLGG